MSKTLKMVLLSFLLTGLSTQGFGKSTRHHKKKSAHQEMDVRTYPPPPPVVTLQQVLDLAEQSSPRVQSLKSFEEAASAGIGIAKAAMLPTVDFQAIDSLGFPGSTGYLGAGGVMGSPYRSGLAGGFVVQQQVYDFGRTDANIDVAQRDVEARRQRTYFEAEQARAKALHIYANCIQLKAQSEFFKGLVDETITVAKEVEGYVQTGQRTIVDRYLSQAQVEEAKTSQAVAEAQLGESEKALALAIGLTGSRPNCPNMNQEATWTLPSSLEEIPYVATAVADLKTEEARREVIRSSYMPKINLVGSLGVMERARLVAKTPYAIGIGVSVPIFDGFKDDYELERSRALISSRQFEISARKLEISTTNAHYDELIAAANVRLQHLKREQALAQKAVDLARQRYSNAEGSLTDVRESIRNLSRTSSAAIAASASKFEASSAKALANAGKVSSYR